VTLLVRLSRGYALGPRRCLSAQQQCLPRRKEKVELYSFKPECDKTVQQLHTVVLNVVGGGGTAEWLASQGCVQEVVGSISGGVKSDKQ